MDNCLVLLLQLLVVCNKITRSEDSRKQMYNYNFNRHIDPSLKKYNDCLYHSRKAPTVPEFKCIEFWSFWNSYGPDLLYTFDFVLYSENQGKEENLWYLIAFFKSFVPLKMSDDLGGESIREFIATIKGTRYSRQRIVTKGETLFGEDLNPFFEDFDRFNKDSEIQQLIQPMQRKLLELESFIREETLSAHARLNDFEDYYGNSSVNHFAKIGHLRRFLEQLVTKGTIETFMTMEKSVEKVESDIRNMELLMEHFVDFFSSLIEDLELRIQKAEHLKTQLKNVIQGINDKKSSSFSDSSE